MYMVLGQVKECREVKRVLACDWSLGMCTGVARKGKKSH